MVTEMKQFTEDQAYRMVLHPDKRNALVMSNEVMRERIKSLRLKRGI